MKGRRDRRGKKERARRRGRQWGSPNVRAIVQDVEGDTRGKAETYSTKSPYSAARLLLALSFIPHLSLSLFLSRPSSHPVSLILDLAFLLPLSSPFHSLSLLFISSLPLFSMARPYNSERVSIARGSALRSLVLSVQYLHGSRVLTKERNLSIPVFQGRLSALRGWNHYRATGWRAWSLYVSLPEKSAILDAAGSPKADGDGLLCIDQKWSAVNHGGRAHFCVHMTGKIYPLCPRRVFYVPNALIAPRAIERNGIRAICCSRAANNTLRRDRDVWYAGVRSRHHLTIVQMYISPWASITFEYF